MDMHSEQGMEQGRADSSARRERQRCIKVVMHPGQPASGAGALH